MSAGTKLYDPNALTTEYYDNTTLPSHNIRAHARRQDVIDAGGIPAAYAQAIWFIQRTTRVSPHLTESASGSFDQVLNTALADGITTWEGA